MGDLKRIKDLFGSNFFGPEELSVLSMHLSLNIPTSLPVVPFSRKLLESCRSSHLLVLGIKEDGKGRPLTLMRFREIFGMDPACSEPCFYNQDWYTKEKFANEITIENRWYLIAKNVNESTRGKLPREIKKGPVASSSWPSAVLTAFAFLVMYLSRNEVLWKHDFVWCRDMDANGDQIYTGRYEDPRGLSKNGFGIHRHLTINRRYGLAEAIW